MRLPRLLMTFRTWSVALSLSHESERGGGGRERVGHLGKRERRGARSHSRQHDDPFSSAVSRRLRGCGGSEVSPSAAFATLRPSLHVRGIPHWLSCPTDLRSPPPSMFNPCQLAPPSAPYPLRLRRLVPSLTRHVSLTESNRREVRARTLSCVGARTNVEPRLSPYLVHATDQFTLFLLAK